MVICTNLSSLLDPSNFSSFTSTSQEEKDFPHSRHTLIARPKTPLGRLLSAPVRSPCYAPDFSSFNKIARRLGVWYQW